MRMEAEIARIPTAVLLALQPPSQTSEELLALGGHVVLTLLLSAANDVAESEWQVRFMILECGGCGCCCCCRAKSFEMNGSRGLLSRLKLK